MQLLLDTVNAIIYFKSVLEFYHLKSMEERKTYSYYVWCMF